MLNSVIQRVWELLWPDRTENDGWCDPAAWDAYYTKALRNEAKARELQTRSRHIRFVVNELRGRCRVTEALDILDAGCGVSLVPELFAHWGNHVTAIDLSQVAAQFCDTRIVDEALLAGCIRIFRASSDAPDVFLPAPKSESEQLLRSLQRPGGAVNRRRCNWNDPALGESAYDVVLNLNGLRRATDKERRTSLESFHRLLRPGGLAILTNVNALDLKRLVASDAAEIGYEQLAPAYHGMFAPSEVIHLREGERRYLSAYWPTG